MKRIAGLALTGVLLAGCGSSGGGSFTSSVEDCDAEDFRNKETDCGFSKAEEDAAKKKKKSSSLFKSKTNSKPFSQGSARR